MSDWNEPKEASWVSDEPRMENQSQLFGDEDVDYDEKITHRITAKMSQLPYETQFHIALSVCWILDLYPWIISDDDIQYSLSQIQSPEKLAAWKGFYDQQMEKLGIIMY